MAKVAIFDEPQQKWIQFDEDTEVLIEYLPKDAAKELNAQVDKIVSRTGAQWSHVWEQKLAECTVKGWRHMKKHDQPGLAMASGEPILFTPENRDMMMRLCREFSSFVGENSIDAKVFLELSNRPAEVAATKED